jgi:glycosyltransferase involved in cell wall biosynthesis
VSPKVPLPKILVIADFYLPAFRGGGPIRSIASLIERMGGEFQFFVLCRERDLINSPRSQEKKAYGWVEVGNARVMYLSPEQLRFFRLRSLLREIDSELLYLNGFFSPFTRRILTLRLLGLLPKKRIVLVPHGEFSSGALGLKSWKKKAYFRVVRTIGLYDNLVWHATSEPERDDIIRWLPTVTKTRNSPVILAPNLLASETVPAVDSLKDCKEPGSARVIFLSRIHPKKNLDLALGILSKACGSIVFDIFGPAEDATYWRKCESLIKTLPDNISVQYRGEVRPENVRNVFSTYHLFLFPTRSENFGYVITEALSAGCLVATSDQTPWKDLREKKAGWWLPLSRPEEYVAAVEKVVAMNADEFTAMSSAARNYAKAVSENPASLAAYRRLFGELLPD